ncbi:hypothetical protein DNL40_14815, partial [Xylanimonas oleitrophica]
PTGVALLEGALRPGLALEAGLQGVPSGVGASRSENDGRESSGAVCGVRTPRRDRVAPGNWVARRP